MSSAPIPMIGSVDGALTTKMVPPEQVDAAKAAGWDNAYKMVGDKGQQKWVPQSQIQSARESKFAITPDSPGAQKMVDPSGKVNFVTADEVDQFKQLGHTQIRPNGTFDLQNIPGEDPLEEANRRQRVYKALTPDEKKSQRNFELKEAAKTGASAAINTALGITGVAPEVSAVINSSKAGIALGTAAGTTAGVATKAATSPLGQTIIKEGGKYLLKGALLAPGYALARKFMKALGD